MKNDILIPQDCSLENKNTHTKGKTKWKLNELAIDSEGNNMEKHHALNQKQQCIIPIAAFTAEGDIKSLKPALNQGLDAPA